MKCIRCKKKIPDKSKFCNLCGAKQERQHFYRRKDGLYEKFLVIDGKRVAFRAKTEEGVFEKIRLYEAKKEQAKVEEEINRLQATIRTATVVADDEITTERVSIGTIVRVKDLDENETYEYAIVGANEADPAADKISNESPVGAGLLGAKRNQTVSISIPAGVIRFKVLSIKKM